MAALPGARLRVDISPADVGRRVSVRYRDDAGGTSQSEVVGVLDRWTGGGREGILRLRRRDGMTMRVDAATLQAARVVPPEISAYGLQLINQRCWPPVESELMGDWELRWSGGATGRANSARVFGSPGMSLRLALKRVREWYAERGAPALVQVPTPSAYDDAFDSHGWASIRSTRVLTTGTARLLQATESAGQRADMSLEIGEWPSSEWFSLVRGYSSATEAEFMHVMRPGPNTAFVTCRHVDSGDLLGIGRAAISGAWAGATSMETAEHARRRGVATTVMAALAKWAADRGADKWFLHVYASNAPALALYDSLGFTLHHRYAYRAVDLPVQQTDESEINPS